MKQYKYNSSKPVKYGLFYRSLSNAKVPYTYSTLQYTGKPEVIGANDYYVTSCNEYTKWYVNKFQIYGLCKGKTFPSIDISPA